MGQGSVGIVVNVVPTNGSLSTAWGVNGGPLPDPGPLTTPAYLRRTNNPAATAGYHQIGVKLIRTHDFYGPLDMRQMYPDQGADPALPGSYNFTNSDIQFRAIVSNNFTPYFRIGDSAGYTNSYVPTNPANWAAAASAVIAHYSDTNLWGSNYLHYVEIGNEPDSLAFWDASSTNFADLYCLTASRMKSNYPALKIGGPGFTEDALVSGTNWTLVFLSRVASNRAPLEFFSWHDYTTDPHAYSSRAHMAAQLLAACGFSNVEQHVTEWSTPASADTILHTALPAASILGASWIAQQREGLAVSLVYRGNDMRMENPEDYGLFYSDTNAKAPAFTAQLWNSMLEYTQRLSTTTPVGSNLWALASRNSSTNLALLICNPTSNATSWQVVLQGRYRARDLQLASIIQTGSNSSYANIPYFGLTNISLSTPSNAIGAWGVQYLTFNILPEYEHWAQEVYGLIGSSNSADADVDGDGMNNYSEYLAGTDPTNSASLLKITNCATASTNLWLSWPSVPGVAYRIQASASLASTTVWADITASLVTNAFGTNSVASQQFYRVTVQSP